MKFKTLYNTDGGGGTSGAASETGAAGTEATIETQSGSEGNTGQETGNENSAEGQNSFFTRTEKKIEESEGQDSETENNENLQTETDLDYEFAGLEAYKGNESYYDTLSETFKKAGISKEQSTSLLELGNQIIEPLAQKLQEYEDQLKPYSYEAQVEKAKAEYASMTPEEKAIHEEINGLLNDIFETDDEFMAFAGRFQDKEGMNQLQALIKHLSGGVNDASAGGAYESARSGAMTLNDFDTEMDKILSGEVSQIDSKKSELYKRARETGNKEVKKLMSKY